MPFPQALSIPLVLPAMKTKPAHIHLKEDATSRAHHSPIPVPLCWMEQIKSQLDSDVASGVLEKVPIGEAVNWCSRMIIVPKNGSPRRTIDLQYLNSQCKRETHHCKPPFVLACQIPPQTKKTIIDATDGDHSIELDVDSRPHTTFITPWGRYRYRRLPQGHLASGDAYTHRYDELIKDDQSKVKCIDDVILYDDDV
uniref:uncharacterized protein LOC120341843 n=1 Tax=Styela clava TaxID=7725 RepID=UPI001939F4D1|nr:uncharacterized protein LOC120341843 [Styela clava]